LQRGEIDRVGIVPRVTAEERDLNRTEAKMVMVLFGKGIESRMGLDGHGGGV
jgi:hypothetical protein